MRGGELGHAELREQAQGLRAATWARQRGAGIVHIPSNDLSFYDHTLDTAAMVGAVPDRYGRRGEVDVDTYFALARGNDALPALEMTKWFDTNYHYLVPELAQVQEFELASTRAIDEHREAASARGDQARQRAARRLRLHDEPLAPELRLAAASARPADGSG